MFDTTQTQAVLPAPADPRLPGMTLLTAVGRQLRRFGPTAGRFSPLGVSGPLPLGATDAELARLHRLPATRQPDDVRWDAILYRQFGHRRP